MPLPDPVYHPELGWSADARILLAYKALLEADAEFAGVFAPPDGGGIIFAELAELVLLESFSAPLWAISILAVEEKNFTSSYGGDLEVVVQSDFWAEAPVGFGTTDDLFRSRVFSRHRQLVRANAGVLVEQDLPLTLAVTKITRVNFDRSPVKSGFLLTRVHTVYTTRIDLLSQEVIS